VAHIQCAGAFGAVDFGAVDGEQVDAEPVDRQAEIARGLDGVGVEIEREFDAAAGPVGADIGYEFGDVGQGLDGADFVVGQHDAHEYRVVGDSGLDSGRVDDAAGFHGYNCGCVSSAT